MKHKNLEERICSQKNLSNLQKLMAIANLVALSGTDRCEEEHGNYSEPQENLLKNYFGPSEKTTYQKPTCGWIDGSECIIPITTSDYRKSCCYEI